MKTYYLEILQKSQLHIMTDIIYEQLILVSKCFKRSAHSLQGNTEENIGHKTI